MKNLKKGFTLVEMLIVVVIIGILAAAILPRLTGAQAATRDTARRSALNQIAQGLELYNTSNGTYPSVITDAGIGTELLTDLKPDYMKSIPGNPAKEEIFKAKIKNTEKSSSKGNFLIAKLSDGTLALITKVERRENANYLSTINIDTTKTAADLKLCGSVKDGATDTANVTTDNQECIAKNASIANLLYVLKL